MTDNKRYEPHASLINRAQREKAARLATSYQHHPSGLTNIPQPPPAPDDRRYPKSIARSETRSTMRFLERLGLQKAKDPQEEMKKWRRELRKEQRAMDREISKLEQMERKSRDECRKYGKEGRQDACKIVAREIVRTRAARNRMLMAKAQINSVNMQLQTQAAMVRAAGCMKKSTEVMRCMNKLVKLPELQKTMMEMQREMERSGLIEEVVGDALDELDGDDVEEETELQVNKVVEELAGDLFKGQTDAPETLPEQQAVEPAEADDDLDTMKARLQAL